MFQSIGIIGTGNMGGALAAAIVKGGFSGRLLLCNRDAQKAKALAEKLGCGEVCDNEAAARLADLLLLCVKPQIMPQVLSALAPSFQERKDRFVLCSPAAGMTTEALAALSGGEYPIIRIMPNTPVAVSCGMIQLCSRNASDGEVEAFMRLLSAAGQLDVLDERLIDAACAVSGCGPAFAYLFAEALADGAVACGLPRAQALAYAAKMLEGSARMILETNRHPGTLKDAVCSPGGATIEGVRTLEQGGFRSAVMDAVIAAFEKSKQLGEGAKK